MIKLKFLFLLSLMCLLSQCKNNQSTDPLLLEALSIQDEAIHIGMDLEKMIENKLQSDTTSGNVEKMGIMKEALKDWKNNMVAIPGVEHEHDHDDHDHDHAHDHNHDHNHASSAAAHLTPEELKNVQIEWKNAVLALQEMIK